MNLTNFLKKELNALKHEVISNEERQELLEMAFEDIADRIDNNERYELATALTTGSGRRLDDFGKHCILNDNAEGWKLIEQEAYYNGYVFQTTHFGNVFLSSRSLGGVLSLCAGWGYDEFAKACLKFAEQDFQKHQSTYKHAQQVHVFVASLANFYYYDEYPEYMALLEENGVYRKIISAWNEPDLLQPLIAEACEAYLYAVYDDGKNKQSDILTFDFIPFDVHMMRLLRVKQGLDMPVCDHPLLTSALMNVPPERPGYEPKADELLQIVLKHEKRIHKGRGD